MKFNINKCHALTVTATNYLKLLMNELPFSKFFYSLNHKIIDYTCQERDLGILVNPKFNFEDHRQAIITKAYQFLGLTKRSCFFVADKRRKRSLYLAMVRSQFEHCSVIWAPKLQREIDSFEKIQKRAIKWILRQEYCSYSDVATYYSKCKEVNILPLSKHFEVNDLIFFHKILNKHIDIPLPPNIHYYSGQSRLRSLRLDAHSFVFVQDNDSESSMRSPSYKSFFYRTIHYWNSLSLDIRNTESQTSFKRLVRNAMWESVQSTIQGG